MNNDILVKSYLNKDLAGSYQLGNTPKVRQDFIALLENALMVLSYKYINMFHSEARDNVHVNSFDGAWLLDANLNHVIDECFMLHPFGDDQVTPNIFPELNIKFMNLGTNAAEDNERMMSLQKFSALSIPEKRNLTLNLKEFAYRHRVALLDYAKNKWITHENGYKVLHDKTKGMGHFKNIMAILPTPLKSGYFFSDADIAKYMDDALKDLENSSYYDDIKQFHAALQLALTYYYQWSVYIRESPKHLGVRVPIDPSATKEVFQLRDVNEGERKKAIINFISEHYRRSQDISDDDKSIFVRKHFRGELKFNWRGLEVHVTPSEYDIRRIRTSKKFDILNKIK